MATFIFLSELKNSVWTQTWIQMHALTKFKNMFIPAVPCLQSSITGRANTLKSDIVTEPQLSKDMHSSVSMNPDEPLFKMFCGYSWDQSDGHYLESTEISPNLAMTLKRKNQ